MTETLVTIEDDHNLFPYTTLGNKNNKKILVLLAGFPDNTITAFGEENLRALSNDYYVISLCLPGYAKKKARKWGYNFEELILLMHRTIHLLVEDSTFFLVGHDWGSHIVQLYQMKYPQDVLKL